MSRGWLLASVIGAVLLAVPRWAAACSLCAGQLPPTLRLEAAQPSARMILYGTLENPKEKDKQFQTNLRITHVFRGDPILGERKVIPLSKFLPFTDAKDPPRFLVFCDVFMNKIDDYRGIPLKSPDAVQYVEKILKMDDRDPAANLQFFFRFLDHADKELSNDAFLEFAKSTDNVIGQVAPKLPVDRLRTWMGKPDQLPSERIGLYCFLLGAAGSEQDASLLQTLLNDGSERVMNAQDGILCGLMNLKPREGWQLTQDILRDGRKGLQQRLCAIRAVRFYHGWQPEKYRAQIQKAMDILLAQGDMADMAVEDLRKWQMWDRTREILTLYGRKGYDGPILKDAIIRYALCCPRDADTARFLEERRKADPAQVKDIEDGLKR